MEVGDIFADEVVDFGFWVLPPVFQFLSISLAPLLRAGDVSDGSIEPYVPEVPGSIWDFESKIGRGPEISQSRRGSPRKCP